jgi:Na+/H+ antiporter
VLALEMVVILGVTILICTVVARRARVAPPILLLVCGVLLGFIPALRGVQLPPEAVLLLFLPALLYWESITTSLREIRKNLRGIMLMSTLLVIVTAAAVAVVAHQLGLAWGPAWVLGAAVAPTDATAVAALTKSLPRRNVTLLRAESLINDGTALVLYSIAVAVTVGEITLSPGYLAGSLALSYGGGALAGALVAGIVILLRRRTGDALTENIVIVLTPFAAFLVADLIGASGVLAVVVAGLIMSQAGPRVGRADSRQISESFWGLSTFLLNASLFVLVGIEVQAAVRGLSMSQLGDGLLAVGAVSVLLVAVRFAFLFGSAYLIRLVDRRPSQRARRQTHGARVISGMSGFRGAVSLAAALAVPRTVASGAPFPDRDMIVFVTTGVIVVLLVIPGLLLPAIVRWANLPTDTGVDTERRLAEVYANEKALEALPDLGRESGATDDVIERLRTEYADHLDVLRAEPDEAEGTETLARHDHYSQLRLALIGRKRAAVVQLRDEGRIDDIVLRDIQDRLDIEEVRIVGRGHAE